MAKLRAEKAEEEVLELMNKARQLETELDVTTERLSLITLQLEEKEKSLMAAEAEVNALNRRVQVSHSYFYVDCNSSKGILFFPCSQNLGVFCLFQGYQEIHKLYPCVLLL